jgi:hypothetical protein
LPQGLDAVGEQQGFATHAGSGEGGLGTGVTTTHYYNIIFINDLHDLFAVRRQPYNDTRNLLAAEQHLAKAFHVKPLYAAAQHTRASVMFHVKQLPGSPICLCKTG